MPFESNKESTSFHANYRCFVPWPTGFKCQDGEMTMKAHCVPWNVKNLQAWLHKVPDSSCSSISHHSRAFCPALTQEILTPSYIRDSLEHVPNPTFRTPGVSHLRHLGHLSGSQGVHSTVQLNPRAIQINLNLLHNASPKWVKIYELFF